MNGAGRSCAPAADSRMTFPAGKVRISAFAAVRAMAAMGAALGPLVCGFLTTFAGWRYSFVIEV